LDSPPEKVACLLFGVVAMCFGTVVVEMPLGMVSIVPAVRTNRCAKREPNRYRIGDMLIAGLICAIIGISLSVFIWAWVTNPFISTMTLISRNVHEKIQHAATLGGAHVPGLALGMIMNDKSQVYRNLNREDFHPQDALGSLPKGTRVVIAASLDLQMDEPKNVCLISALDGTLGVTGCIARVAVILLPTSVQ
jgi:hypothetical protein